MTSHAAADRNLLFGILAVQMDFISPSQLISAMNSWVLDKSRPLGRHLVEGGMLAAETQDLIQALVDRHVQQHGGRAEKSLAALSSVEPLRRELAAIADNDVQKSLARAAAPMSRHDRHATVAAPREQLGPAGQRFHILRPHASGGLGKVSIARDAELNRLVAVKELQDRHADDPDSRARFLQEAEITGGLEHPGVVPIYGLGQYADGRPFYAMRFVRGDSLAEAIDRFHREAEPSWTRAADVLQLRRLLGRFLDVCNAMEYAHSRGVLHRDLKPGNIMLGQYGETLVVDWGLAKPVDGAKPDATAGAADATVPMAQEPALRPQSGSGSAPTQMGSAIGTPAYMSPEQAAGRLDQLGPASDVYSLGATLYVLLTGQPPQQDDDLGVVLARVERGEFPSPRTIRPAVPRALEAICLKAMARLPHDRYASPRELADDVEAWLADEPVSALDESLAARSFRWVKRHRTLVTSGAAMVLVATAALAVGNLQLRVANEAEREAKHAAMAAKLRAEAAQAEAERQTSRNEELLALARKSLDRYESLSQSEVFRRYGMESIRGDLLEAALEFYATLARQSGESEAVRADRGSAFYRLGAAYWQLGRMDQAADAFQQALALYQKLEGERPANAAYPRGAALALAALGELLTNARLSEQAAQPLADARTRLDALHVADPANADVSVRLAHIDSLEGERLRQLGQTEEAATTWRKGVDLLQAVDLAPLDDAAKRDVRYRLARALSQLATHETHAMWKFKEARQHVDQAAVLMRALFAERPDLGDCGFSLVQILRNSGFLYAREHYYEQARSAYLEALDVITKVDQLQPGVPHYRQELAEMLHAIGSLHRPLDAGDLSPEALARLEQAVTIGRQLVEQYPQQTDRKFSQARYESSLGGAYQLRGRIEEARRCFDASAALLNDAGLQAAETVDALKTLGDMQYTVANQLADSGDTERGLAGFDDAEKTLKQLADRAPRMGEAYLSLANVFIERSNCLEKSGRLSDAIAELDKAVAVNAKMQELAQAPWMKSTSQAVVALARTLRWGYLKRIRGGALRGLVDQGQYELAADQAQRVVALSGDAADHYLAARTLAYAAKAAQADPKLDEAKRTEQLESMASEAVNTLAQAWKAGQIRRRETTLSSLLSAKPTLDQLQREEDFGVLRERADYAELVRRIETETPPTKPPQSPSDRPVAEHAP